LVRSSEIWDADEEVAGETLRLVVNGHRETINKNEIDELTDFIKDKALEAGIKKFVCYINGSKMSPSEVDDMDIDDVDTIEIEKYDKAANGK